MSDCGNVKKVFVPTKDKEEKKETITPVKGIEITDIAAEKIQTFVKNDGLDPNEVGLYVKVVTDGCSGKSYDMSMKNIKEETEKGAKVFEKNGSTLMIEKVSYLFVTGSILDYAEALTGSGFSLNNPNIKRSCSCGSSFAI